jgi:hypothetical protein
MAVSCADQAHRPAYAGILQRITPDQKVLDLAGVAGDAEVGDRYQGLLW